jgi:hypothetical protein
MGSKPTLPVTEREERTGLPALIVTAFLIGLAGGVHCVAMCGGFVAALNLNVPRPLPAPRPPGLAAAPLAFDGACAAARLQPRTGRQLRVRRGACRRRGSLGLLLDDVLPAQILMPSPQTPSSFFSVSTSRGSAPVLARAGGVLLADAHAVRARASPRARSPARVWCRLAWGWIRCGSSTACSRPSCRERRAGAW